MRKYNFVLFGVPGFVWATPSTFIKNFKELRPQFKGLKLSDLKPITFEKI